MRVKAKMLCYYENKRRKEGEVFALKEKRGFTVDPKTGKKVPIVISPEEQFSETYMERLDITPKPKPAPSSRFKKEKEVEEDAD